MLSMKQVGVDTRVFQRLEWRLPVDAGAFHRGGGDAVSSQPAETAAVAEGDVIRLKARWSLGYADADAVLSLGWTGPDGVVDDAALRTFGGNAIFNVPSGVTETTLTVPTTEDTTAEGVATLVFSLVAVPQDPPRKPDYTLGDPSSATVRVLDDDTVPAMPRNLSASEGNEQVTLTWEPPTEQAVDKYRHRYRERGGSWGSWTEVNAAVRSVVVDGLTNDVAHTFEVQAHNARGWGTAASKTATPGRVVLIEPSRIDEGESSTLTIRFPEAPYDTDRNYTLVLSRTLDEDADETGAKAEDFTVRIGGSVDPPTFRNLANAHSHTGRQPHYRLTLPAETTSLLVGVRAVDDDTPEWNEEASIRVFEGNSSSGDWSKWVNKRQSGSDTLRINASDRSAHAVSASISWRTATVTFNRSIELLTHPGVEVPAWETSFLLFTGAEPVLNSSLYYEAAPGHPDGVYAESISVSGSKLTVRFPRGVGSGTQAWVAYDRTSVDAPLGDPLERTHPAAAPPGGFAIQALSSSSGAALPALSAGDAATTESGDGNDTHLTFTVTLEPASTETVTVDYETADGTATAGDDYTAKSGTLTFDPGDTQKTVRVTVHDDSVEDGGETLTVTLSNPSGATLERAEATGTINNTETEADRLTASFSGMPESHDGSSEFSFTLTFSEEPDEELSYRTLRDHAFEVSEGNIVKARRGQQGSNRTWTIEVEPDGSEAVTIRLPATTDCSATGAICTDDGRKLSNSPSDTVDGPPSEPLTASFSGMPAEHDGSSEFTFTLTFSEEPDEDLSYRTLRDDAFDVSGGEIGKAKRAEQGKNRTWTIHVDPDRAGDVSIRLPATQSCSATGAICTGDGRMLSNSTSDTVRGPAGISVADATAEENTDSSIDFTVTLDRAASGTVTVDYQTADGTATAGSDYTAASGTLTFAAGERTKTISVTLLDDTHDEGEETFTLTLSNASGAVITDGEATGTIENHDPMPRTLLARFGRTAAVHVVEHVEERLQAPREPGFQGRFAGRELRKGMERDIALSFLSRLRGTAGVNPGGGGAHGAMAAMGAHGGAAFRPSGVGSGAGMGISGGGSMMGGAAAPARLGAGMGRGAMPGGMSPGSMQTGAGGMLGGGGLLQMGLGGGDVLTGSAFALNRKTKSGGVLSFWSRGAQSTFHGREGALSLNGDVRTTMFGADYAKGRMVTGLSLARSKSLGGYSAETAGQVESSVTGLYPWLGYQVTERVSVWGVAGYGAGGLVLTPGTGTPLESGLSMAMAAGGTRGDLIAGGTGGFALAFKADALWVGTSIDGVDGPAGRLKATGAAVTRFRTGLEGSRDYNLGNVLSLKPLVEVGLRHDGGDAETGAGMDVGGGVMIASPGTGLAVDMRVRMLLVHQAEGFRERGMSVSLSYNPTPSTPLGFSARVAPSWGGQATGGAQALWGRETMAGMAHGGVASGNRLDGEVGYGLPVGSRFVGTPRVGLTTSEYGQAYRLGYGMTLTDKKALGFELGVDAERRESPAAGRTDTGVLGRATVRW